MIKRLKDVDIRVTSTHARRIKLNSPNHVSCRLSVGLWGVDVISATKSAVWTSGVKNTAVHFKLTRLSGHCWPSWPILPLINKIKIVISANHQRYWLGIAISSVTMTLAYFRQRLWKVCTDHRFAKRCCQKIFWRIFQVRFAKGRIFKVRFSMLASFL